MAKEKVTKASASTMEPFETGGIDPGKLKALSVAMEKIEKDFGKGAIMALGQMPAFDGTAIHSGLSQGQSDRDLWPRVIGEDYACHPCHGRDPTGRRDSRNHRCRACF